MNNPRNSPDTVYIDGVAFEDYTVINVNQETDFPNLVRLGDTIHLHEGEFYETKEKVNNNEIITTHSIQKNVDIFVMNDVLGNQNIILNINTAVNLSNRLPASVTNSRPLVLLPQQCVLVFGTNGALTNGVIMSNGTMLHNMPNAASDSRGYSTVQDIPNVTLDIVGKIFDVHGNELSARGDVIERSVPLLYNFIPQRYCSGQYDNNCLNKMALRARNLGLTDCIVMLSCFTPLHDHYTNKPISVLTPIQKVKFNKLDSTTTQLEDKGYGPYSHYVNGGWTGQGHLNTPHDITSEIFINRLSVKAVKFHASSNYNPSLYDYCFYVFNYVKDLVKCINDFNATALGQYAPIKMFREVYIVNERNDWTIEHSGAVKLIRQLADKIRTIDAGADVPNHQLELMIAYAGCNDMLVSDHSLYDKVNPGWNFYPSVTYVPIPVSEDNSDNNVMTPEAFEAFITDNKLVETVLENFTALGTFWDGNHLLDGTVPLSETGTRPNEKCLRKTSLSNINDCGTFQEDVMPIYWTVLNRVAQIIPFRYIDVFFHDWIYDNPATGVTEAPIYSRSGANLVERMYNIFLNFGSNETE